MKNQPLKLRRNAAREKYKPAVRITLQLKLKAKAWQGYDLFTVDSRSWL